MTLQYKFIAQGHFGSIIGLLLFALEHSVIDYNCSYLVMVVLGSWFKPESPHVSEVLCLLCFFETFFFLLFRICEYVVIIFLVIWMWYTE